MKTTLRLLTGIAMGIGIGMLLAPDKGRKTRKKLADSAGDLFEKLKRFVSLEKDERPTSSRKKPKASTSRKKPQTSRT